MQFDLATTDALLTTTRAVRKRLDLERPVSRATILECLEIAVQAPTGGNRQGWRWIVLDDAEQRAAIAALYQRAAHAYLKQAATSAVASGDAQRARVYESAVWLADNLARVPALVIPCIEGKLQADSAAAALAGLYGSIFPAVWSFQLALRARGLGSALTTLHLVYEQEAAKLLGLPDDVMQVALLPVAYTKGTDFKRAARPPVSTITHWNRWS